MTLPVERFHVQIVLLYFLALCAWKEHAIDLETARPTHLELGTFKGMIENKFCLVRPTKYDRVLAKPWTTLIRRFHDKSAQSCLLL
jgi:hypothetical protein